MWSDGDDGIVQDSARPANQFVGWRYVLRWTRARDTVRGRYVRFAHDGRRLQRIVVVFHQIIRIHPFHPYVPVLTPLDAPAVPYQPVIVSRRFVGAVPVDFLFDSEGHKQK